MQENEKSFFYVLCTIWYIYHVCVKLILQRLKRNVETGFLNLRSAFKRIYVLDGDLAGGLVIKLWWQVQ